VVVEVDSNVGRSEPGGANTRSESIKKGVAPDLKRGLVGHWKFDDGSGKSAADSSGQDNHGKVEGRAKWAKGKLGGALYFNGNDSRVAFPCKDHKVFAFTAWFKADSTGGSFGPRVISTPGYSFYVAKTAAPAKPFGYVVNRRGGFEVWKQPQTQVLTGRWYHVAVVHEARTGKVEPAIYMDGVNISASYDKGRNRTAPPISTAGTGYIGNVSTRNRGWHGLIDDVRIYDRRLSEDEVRAIYSQEAGSVATAPKTDNAEPDELLLSGFETAEDVRAFDRKMKYKLVKSHVTEGLTSMAVPAGGYLSAWPARGSALRDWSGYDSLQIDVFSDATGPSKVELSVWDDSTAIGKNEYWTRHNSYISLPPGKGIISLDLHDLYRGEHGTRNTVIKRNIDLDKIKRLDIILRAKTGTFYFDNMRLVRGPGPAISLDIGNGVKMDFIYIKPGTFVMGGEGNFEHPVAITRGFYMGKYEVTETQYQAVTGENPSAKKNPKGPVQQVTWIESDQFCRKVSAHTRRVVRLPTEAEWEYACRAGTTTAWSHGDDSKTLGQYAWCKPYSWGPQQAVGTKKPNPWGLHDMHGNVWEWCSDWHDDNYYKNSPRENPTGPARGGYKVLRGGCWYSKGDACRPARRHKFRNVHRDHGLGFRAVLEP